MNIKLALSLLALSLLIFTAGCDDDESAGPVVVAWEFSEGDCASNGIEKVLVEVIPASGTTMIGEASCTEGKVDLGTGARDVSYSVVVQGRDASGIVRAQNYGNTGSSLEMSVRFGDIEVTLHPKSADVTVTWNGCPGSVILPYHITLYNPPAQTGGALTDKVTGVQQGCAVKEATLENIDPGDYIVELDSRAVTPKVLGTQPVTVTAGEDVSVHLNLP